MKFLLSSGWGDFSLHSAQKRLLIWVRFQGLEVRTLVMRALSIVLFGGMAVSAAGFLAFQPPGRVADVEALSISRIEFVICEKPLESFLSLETPISEKKELHTPLITGKVEEAVTVEQPPVERVQSMEERTDDMLFEADALGYLPFDQAVIMPFE